MIPNSIIHVAEFVLHELGISTMIPNDVDAGSTSIRVMNIAIFDSGGGQLTNLKNNNLITYTGKDGDSLTGIPASGTGSISQKLWGVESKKRDILFLSHFVDSFNLKLSIERYAEWIDSIKSEPDADKKRFRFRPWLDRKVTIRDDDDDTYNEVIPDSIDLNTGEIVFNSARSESFLYLAGKGYNPYLTIADLVEQLSNDDRWHRFSQSGSLSFSQPDAGQIAQRYKQRGHILTI